MNPPPKFHIKIWNVDVSAEGVLGVGAASFLVVFLVVAWRLF